MTTNKLTLAESAVNRRIQKLAKFKMLALFNYHVILLNLVKTKMKITKSALIYNIMANIPICFFLSLVANLAATSTIDWINIAINFTLGFPVAMIVGLFVPLVRLGKWFTSLFKVKNDTYTNNLPYRLLATFISALIFFVALNPFLAFINTVIINHGSFGVFLLNWLRNIPLMSATGFVLSLVFDIPAYQVAHRIDPHF